MICIHQAGHFTSTMYWSFPFQKVSTSQDSSMLVQNDSATKDSLSSASPDAVDEINQLRCASGDHSSIAGSGPDEMQVV